MTATADFHYADAILSASVRTADGARMMVRVAKRLVGTSLVIAAIALWIAPGAVWESDILLFKLVLSIFAGLAGIGMMLTSYRSALPEVEIDTIRREVRLVRPQKGGRKKVLERCPFADLSRVERDGVHVRLWGKADRLMAEAALRDSTAMNSLVAGLRDAGKLA